MRQRKREREKIDVSLCVVKDRLLCERKDGDRLSHTIHGILPLCVLVQSSCHATLHMLSDRSVLTQVPTCMYECV